MKLGALKFVQGAISKKDFVPAMSHFVIQDGQVRAYNGVMTISSPIEVNLTCAPKGVPLVKAISQCNDVISMAMTGANRLRIQSGPFKAFIDCVEMENLPHLMPEGEIVELDGEQLVRSFEVLETFVGDDASRPWTNGILLRNQSAFATNNVCLVEYWLGVQFPFVANIPLQAVREVLRVGQAPSHAQLSANSVTFHYDDGRWIRTLLYSTDWPDLTKILDVPAAPVAVPTDLFTGLDYIKNFTGDAGIVHFHEGQLRTHLEDGIGASFDVYGLPGEGAYKLGMLAKLNGVAQSVDFAAYPKPLIFYGDRLRGAIVGYRP